ncbi:MULTISPECIES: hypothetical protein [Neisseria]|nr:MULTISPECIES: hypothetical protein [Neisseria]
MRERRGVKEKSNKATGRLKLQTLHKMEAIAFQTACYVINS